MTWVYLQDLGSDFSLNWENELKEKNLKST